MTTRELDAARKRLTSAFLRASELPEGALELRSDYARYLCVLVSGFVEVAVFEMAAEHCRRRASPTVSNYGISQLGKLQNIKCERLAQLLSSFDPSWRAAFEAFVGGPRSDALDSAVDLRNKIAHGESVGLTLSRVTDYRDRIVEILDFVEELFLPAEVHQ
ncbi:HEPN domain-containing protein [Rivibacter subsaxonicus]|uniref:HEPN domain-containing protein n=1 Tax=Rivibacter subsaxonicus TaxID=457575 RepID=UPI00102C44DC|nr:HEPN domain-containing protein [Rivibacter subsaxonicus]